MRIGRPFSTARTQAGEKTTNESKVIYGNRTLPNFSVILK
jgi:hypothetical protein